jgi:NADPH:quinone reductase-like Zn-dependent oxidoreductase
MLTEYKVLDETAAVHIPAHLEWEEAAAYPCAGVTTWNALTGGSPLLAGDTVLTMGTGGVSLFAVQFGKLFGATVIATTSTPEKAAVLKKLGADEVINYMDQPDWHLRVKEITKGRGADHIVEVGGAGTLERSFKSLSLNGQINLVGWLAKENPLLDINNFAATVGSMRRIAAGHRRHHIEMNRAVEAGKSRPVIDRVFDFSHIKDAYNYYAAGNYLGKVIVTLPYHLP